MVVEQNFLAEAGLVMPDLVVDVYNTDLRLELSSFVVHSKSKMGLELMCVVSAVLVPYRTGL